MAVQETLSCEWPRGNATADGFSGEEELVAKLTGEESVVLSVREKPMEKVVEGPPISPAGSSTSDSALGTSTDGVSEASSPCNNDEPGPESSSEPKHSRCCSSEPRDSLTSDHVQVGQGMPVETGDSLAPPSVRTPVPDEVMDVTPDTAQIPVPDRELDAVQISASHVNMSLDENAASSSSPVGEQVESVDPLLVCSSSDSSSTSSVAGNTFQALDTEVEHFPASRDPISSSENTPLPRDPLSLEHTPIIGDPNASSPPLQSATFPGATAGDGSTCTTCGENDVVAMDISPATCSTGVSGVATESGGVLVADPLTAGTATHTASGDVLLDGPVVLPDPLVTQPSPCRGNDREENKTSISGGGGGGRDLLDMLEAMDSDVCEVQDVLEMLEKTDPLLETGHDICGGQDPLLETGHDICGGQDPLLETGHDICGGQDPLLKTGHDVCGGQDPLLKTGHDVDPLLKTGHDICGGQDPLLKTGHDVCGGQDPLLKTGHDVDPLLKTGHDVCGVQDPLLKTGHDVCGVQDPLLKTGHDVCGGQDPLLKTGHDVCGVQDPLLKTGHDVCGGQDPLLKTGHDVCGGQDPLIPWGEEGGSVSSLPEAGSVSSLPEAGGVLTESMVLEEQRLRNEEEEACDGGNTAEEKANVRVVCLFVCLFLLCVHLFVCSLVCVFPRLLDSKNWFV